MHMLLYAPGQVESLFRIVGVFILVSLLRRARKKYNIHGNDCQVKVWYLGG